MRRFTVLFALAILALAAGPVFADPNPGQILKFQQVPMDGLVIQELQGPVTYWGHDEMSVAWDVNMDGIYGDPNPDLTEVRTFMADDFADRFNTPVVHVRWWGSYLNNFEGQGGVQKFLIAFEADQPAQGAADWSKPIFPPIAFETVKKVPPPPLGQPILPGTFTEKPISPGGGPAPEMLYEYNAELAVPFNQQPDTVYWLKIVALVDNPAQDNNVLWGWHNRDYTKFDPLAATNPPLPGERTVGVLPDGQQIWHFQDNAVWGDITVRDPIAGQGLDPEILVQLPRGPTHYAPGFDGGSYIEVFSKDLAFELYTVPEPGTLAILLTVGAVAAVAFFGRRK